MIYHYVITLQVQLATPPGNSVIREYTGLLTLYPGSSRSAVHEELKDEIAESHGVDASRVHTLFWSLEPDALS